MLIGPAGLRGAMAQLVARLVRNEKVRGSSPLSSTTSPGAASMSSAYGPR
jgi:hypothetical protein